MQNFEQTSQILDFWFEELSPGQWFFVDPDLDKTIRERFGPTYETLCNVCSETLPEFPLKQALAAIITLDQFPRNMFRSKPQAYATDELALNIALSTIEKGEDSQLNDVERSFVYLPFQHSENRKIQARSIELHEKLGDERTLGFAHQHKVIIDRFGRFPHRNKILGRESSPAEIEFLKEPGSSF